MRSLLGRFHRPFARSAEEQLLLLNNLGDGSTLSLDFTTGVLDPRLTFTRTSNATFINSNGLVEWAAANEFRNTGWVTSTTPTGWNVTFGTGTTTWNNDGTLTMNTGGSSTRPFINANSFTVSQGIAYTFGYTVVSASGSPQISDVITSTVAGETFAINGATVGPTTVVQAGDVVSCTFTPTGTTAVPRMGPGVLSGITNTAMTITRPQMNPGVSLQSYLANSSTTAANNNTPRFDHDPTSIGTPRGLLIEGSANNLARYSETLETTGGFWGYNAATRTVESSDVNPTGATGSISFGPTTNGGSRYCGLFLTGQTTTVAYTYSVWVKAKGTSSLVVTIQNSAGAVNSNARIISQPSGANASFAGSGGGFPQINNLSSTGWTKIELTTTGTLGGTGALNVFMYPNNTSTQTTADTVFVWGAQLETGSGASSYIPTGASQGSRAADNCYIYDTTSSGGLSWFKTATQGTIYVEMFKRTAGTAFGAAGFGTRANSFEDFMLYQAVGNNWLSFNWGAGEYVTNYSALSSPFLIKAAVALSPSTPATEADSTVSINGSNSALNTGPNIALPFTSDLFCIGSRGAAAGTSPSQNYAETAIKRIKFFPFAMTAAQMNAMTTL